MSSKTLRMIAVSQENYLTLKRLGNAGDSFNDVISAVLNKVKILQTGPSLDGPDQLQLCYTQYMSRKYQ
jgi:hypothetical protein